MGQRLNMSFKTIFLPQVCIYAAKRLIVPSDGAYCKKRIVPEHNQDGNCCFVPTHWFCAPQDASDNDTGVKLLRWSFRLCDSGRTFIVAGMNS
jgi:hypothetical protein